MVMRGFEAVLTAVCVGAALFVGLTAFMPAAVYSSWWWFAFWGVVAAGICVSVVRCRLWRKPWVMGLHIAFLLMLAGGAVTAVTGGRGTVHLRPGVAVDRFVTAGGDTASLPLALTLECFAPEYYPGMSIPRDFHSHVVTADGDSLHISMNRIGRVGAWRFYQSSFDGLGGSVLSVSHDPAGIALTYAGYFMFALCGLAMLVRSRRSCVPFVVLLLEASSASAAPAIPDSVADVLQSRQVVFMGRVVPFGTMASELTYKLTGQGSVGPLGSARFVASLLVFGPEWRGVKFIKVKDSSLCKALGSDSRYVSVASLYGADGRYLPESLFAGGDGPLDSEILKLDEKVALLAELWSGQLFTPLPPGSPYLRGDADIRSELLYIRVRPERIYFILALSMAFWAIMSMAFRLRFAIAIVSASLFGLGMAVFVWRWSVVGHVPLSNAAEIMFFVAVAIAGVSAVGSRKSSIVGALGLMMSGFAGLVSWLSLKEPAMTPLMPVLASPWLAVHVSLVMVAYAILSFTLPVPIVAIAMPALRQELVGLSLRLLAPGVYLLGLGIFAGAMWANVSWGRYWAWDPKETWALTTMLLYAVPLHPGLGMKHRPAVFHAYLAIAFLSIIMTYAGVNYLPSQHAYQ